MISESESNTTKLQSMPRSAGSKLPSVEAGAPPSPMSASADLSPMSAGAAQWPRSHVAEGAQQSPTSVRAAWAADRWPMPAGVEQSPIGSPAQQSPTSARAELSPITPPTALLSDSGVALIEEEQDEDENFHIDIRYSEEGVAGVEDDENIMPLQFKLAIEYTQKGNTEGLEDLARQGTDLKRISNTHGTNLTWVAAGHGQAGCLRVLDRLCGKDYLRATRGKVASTAAHAAALQGHCGCILVLAELLGPEFLQISNDQGDTPAHFAVSFPNNHDGLAVIQALDDAGAGYTLKIADKRGFTPFHWAVKHGLVGAMRMLVGLGCDPTVRQRTGENASHTACLNLQPKALRVLVQLAGNDIIFTKEFIGGLTCVHAAAQKGAVSCMQVIEELGGKQQLRVVDDNGRTAAHHAAGYNHVKVLKMLVEHGCEDTMVAKDNGGHVPADFAFTKRHDKTMAYLRQFAPPAQLDNRAAGGANARKGGGSTKGGRGCSLQVQLPVLTLEEHMNQMALYDAALADADRTAKRPAATIRQKKQLYKQLEMEAKEVQRQAHEVLQALIAKECVICFDELRSVCVLPCRHYNYCQGCADVMKKEKLPCAICRGVVKSYVSLEYMEKKGLIPIF